MLARMRECDYTLPPLNTRTLKSSIAQQSCSTQTVVIFYLAIRRAAGSVAVPKLEFPLTGIYIRRRLWGDYYKYCTWTSERGSTRDSPY